MHRDRFLFPKSLVKVLALQQLRDGVLRHQTHEFIRAHRAHPAPVEIDHRLLGIENLEHLLLVCLRILLDLLAAQRRACHRASGGITNHSREIANQKDCRVPQILKMLELAQHDGVSEVQIGGGRIHPQLHAQRFAGGA